MKKILLMILTGISMNVFGQVQLIGIQGGVNMTNQSSPNIFKDSKFRTGIIGGLNYEFIFKSKYSLGADLLYSQKGFNDKMIFVDDNGNPTGITSDLKYYYDYLSLPLKIGYSSGDKLKGFVKIGICPSVLLKAEMTTPKVNNNGNYIGNETTDATNNASKLDLGGLIELGAGYGLNNTLDLFSSITYNHSLTTFSNSKNDYFSDAKMRHYGFSLAMGIKYKLEGK